MFPETENTRKTDVITQLFSVSDVLNIFFLWNRTKMYFDYSYNNKKCANTFVYLYWVERDRDIELKKENTLNSLHNKLNYGQNFTIK